MGDLPSSGMENLATAMTLRTTLRLVSPLLLLGTGVSLAVDVLRSGERLSPWALLSVGILGLVAGLTLSRRALSLGWLRALELAALGAVAGYLFVRCYSRILGAAADGDTTLALLRWQAALLHAVLLILVYGIFVPNTWRRTTMVVVPVAALPFLLVLLLRLRHPELAGFLATTVAGRAGYGMFEAAIGAAVAILGAWLISRYTLGYVRSSMLGMYELSERIGSGGMGEVWLARHHVLARPAAIKLVRPELLGGHDREAGKRALQRFEREAQVTAALRSPHTIDLYDFGVSQTGVFFYVMEYLDGLDLATMIERFGPVPAERAIHFLMQVCDSLSDAHDNGLIHRDIKPANIHVCRMGITSDYVKVLDFGLVKPRGGQATDPNITTEDSTTGTPAYMAPELITGAREVDERSDLYALGCVGYWLLTGRPLFEAATPAGLLVDHVKTVPSPPSARTELRIPKELDAILLKCVEKNPADRFASARELAHALSVCPQAEIWTSARAEQWWKTHVPSERLPSQQKFASQDCTTASRNR